jgi:rhodanese-related sulfurtransferase
MNILKPIIMARQFFPGKGFMSGGYLNLTPREAYAEATSGTAFLVDVREEGIIGARRFHVNRLFYMPLSQLKAHLEDIPKDIPLILADSVGLRSHDAMMILMEAGFTNIANLAGGLVEWERDGLPVLVDPQDQLSGACICQLKPRNRRKSEDSPI